MLTIDDLRHQRLQRATINHETYKMLYSMVSRKIVEMQHVRPPVYTLTWAIPPMIPGRPLYKLERAARYIGDKLRRGKFECTERGTGTLFIDWEAAYKAPGPAAKKKKKDKAPQLKTASSSSSSSRLAGLAARAERLTGRWGHVR